jgi:glycosyltransferase involved in cell wall biosynthesis
MERPFFTVVMPAYGVEKYLKKAVDSIRHQTFSDWELIIVEDGSPDRTGELAERLAGRIPVSEPSITRKIKG